MRALILFALFGLLFAEIPSYTRRGHFQGRSGNVMISPNQHRASSGVLLVDHSRHTREGTIDDINVANLVAHLFQSPPPSNEQQPLSIDRSSFPVLSLFSAPPANVFISIESITPEALTKFPTLSQNRRKVEIKSTYQSHDALADLETLITGVSPSQHGIVGRTWMSSVGTETSAFADRGSGSHADSLFDVLALTSPESLVLSMSADEQVASSIGVRVPSRHNSPSVLSYYWNSNRQNFGTLPKHRVNHPLKSTRADILGSLLSRDLFVYEGVTFDMDETTMQVLVTSRSTETETMSSALFDLNSGEDFRIFVELYFVAKVARALQEGGSLDSYVKDDHPDSFAFSFDAIRAITSKYGEKSAQFSTALSLIDAAMGSFMDNIQVLYRHRASSQIALLPPTEASLSPDTIDGVDEILSNSVGSGRAYLPEIYMGKELSSSGEGDLVARLNEFLNERGFAAYWFGRQDLHAQDLFLSGKGASFGKKSSRGPAMARAPRTTEFNWNVYKWLGFKFNWTGIVYTQQEVEAYQIQFWTSFFLIIISIGGCCSMCLLNPEKNNEILYRQTALGRETDTIPGGEYDFQPM